MKIYFDSNKQANAFKIDNPLCIINESDWIKFSKLTLGVDYDVNKNGIMDLRETEEYKTQQSQKEQKEQINKIKAKLIELDNKTIRPLRAGETEKLKELELEAEALRDELNELKNT